MNLIIIVSILSICIVYLSIGLSIAGKLVTTKYSINYPVNNTIKLVQISDTHIRNKRDKVIERTIRKVNELKPDILLFSGDLYDHGPISEELVQSTIRYFKQFKCSNKIAIYGNHDVNTKTKKAYIRTIEEAGFRLLKNNELSILGIDFYALDSLSGDPNYNIDKSKKLIVLAHEPDAFITINNYPNVISQISGHSHGGQIRIPFLPAFNLPAGSKTYYKKYNKVGNKELYVSYGLGNSRHNIRLFVRKEICVYYIKR